MRLRNVRLQKQFRTVSNDADRCAAVCVEAKNIVLGRQAIRYRNISSSMRVTYYILVRHV